MGKSNGEGDKLRWVGFDLGGTKMYSVVFDEKFAPLGSERRPTDGHEGGEAGLKKIIETVGRSLEAADCPPKALGGIGIGCPGIVDMERGILRTTPNLGWPDIPLAKALEKEFGCPVYVLNDVDAGTYGEYVAGAGKGARTLLGVFPGTGVGGGCIYDGKLLRGKRFSAMEIGAVRWPSVSLGSGPGEHPIMELFSSRLGIAASCAAEAFRGKAPALMKKAGTDLSKIKSKAIAQSYGSGDPGTVAVVENALEYLALGVGGAVNLLAPDQIVLGGGLVEAMPDLFVDRMKELLAKFASAELVEDLKIKAAKLGDEAAVVGAAHYAAAEAS
ncbi:ROK family protein [soil metagenome]